MHIHAHETFFRTSLLAIFRRLWSCRQKTQSLAQEHLKRATTVSGPGFLAMEVGPLWLFLSYLAVAGFTHLMSANLFRSSHDKKQAQLPPKAVFTQSTMETAPCGLMDFFNKHKEGPGIDKWAAG